MVSLKLTLLASTTKWTQGCSPFAHSYNHGLLSLACNSKISPCSRSYKWPCSTRTGLSSGVSLTWRCAWSEWENFEVVVWIGVHINRGCVYTRIALLSHSLMLYQILDIILKVHAHLALAKIEKLKLRPWKQYIVCLFHTSRTRSLVPWFQGGFFQRRVYTRNSIIQGI
jgi:hypothetical protein